MSGVFQKGNNIIQLRFDKFVCLHTLQIYTMVIYLYMSLYHCTLVYENKDIYYTLVITYRFVKC